MLTNHCYENIRDGLDNPEKRKVRIKDCCSQTNPDDPTCSDCCYDSWQSQLKEVSQSYKQKTEESDQLRKKLVFVTDRRDRYRTWVAELDKAEDKARAICHQLEIIVSQSYKIWYNSCRAVDAIKILFCMVRDFYIQVDYLKKRYDDLQVCLVNNHDPSLVKGQGILKYLEEYYQKLEIVIKTRDEIIKAILEAIKISNLIRNNISTKSCPCPDPQKPYDPCKPDDDDLCPECDEHNRFYGFKTIICEWYNDFKCGDTCEERDPCAEQPEQQQQSKQGYTPEENTSEENKEKCKLKPVIKFPICNDNYKITIEEWLKADEKEVTKLSGDLKDLNKKKESLQACKDSLVKAIAEVDPKERCK